MVHSYSQAFSPLEIVHHSELAQLISDDNLMVLEPISLGPDEWKITIIAYDYHGELSLICGLLFEYGFDILSGQVFTYQGSDSSADESRPKIVDVFRVRRSAPETSEPSTAKVDTIWQTYRDDLHGYLRRLHRGEWQLIQGDLAKRVAASIENTPTSEAPLYPVELNFDNTLSDRYTVFTIRGRDTEGFLYELTHALALNGVSIGCVELQTVQGIANDTLYVTDESGKKITDPDALQKLRTTTVLIKHFTHLLPHSPNPVAALLHFREFLAQLTTRPDWPSEIASLEQSDVLDALARLLGVSDFLWNDFLRMQYANLFPVVRDVAQHARRIAQSELAEQLTQELLDYKGHAQRVAVLEAFRDREMFRVDMRHILGQIGEFGDFSNELTDVAEVVVRGSLQLCLEELEGRFGVPQLSLTEEDSIHHNTDTESLQQCPISLCALGKCGGRELGFASDIELMLLYAGPGETTGPEKISNKEYCLKLFSARRSGLALRAASSRQTAAHRRRSRVWRPDCGDPRRVALSRRSLRPASHARHAGTASSATRHGRYGECEVQSGWAGRCGILHSRFADYARQEPAGPAHDQHVDGPCCPRSQRRPASRGCLDPARRLSLLAPAHRRPADGTR